MGEAIGVSSCQDMYKHYYTFQEHHKSKGILLTSSTRAPAPFNVFTASA